MQIPCQHCGTLRDSSLNETGGFEFCGVCHKLNLHLPAGDFSFVLLDEYKIEERIGMGGNAIVCRARHMATGYEYALKIQSTRHEVESRFAEDFLQEVNVASELVHDNIARIYSGQESGGILYIVMELVEGINLGEYLEHYGPMPAEDATAAAIFVCQALDYVWSNFLMIHRDVKPYNIMINGNGDVKLLDFGLTAAHGLAVSESRNVVGTPFYVSPEQVQPHVHQDNRSDIYSLGCTLYHLVAGMPPFNFGGIHEVIQSRLRMAPPDVRDIAPTVSPGLAAVIRTMMAVNPDERYATAAEASEDLLRVRSGLPPLLINPNRLRANQ